MNVLSIGTPRNVAPGTALSSLNAATQIAIAICAEIGVAGAAKAAKSNAWGMFARLAIDAQAEGQRAVLAGEVDDEAEGNALRDDMFRAYVEDVTKALHDAAIETYVTNLGLHQHAQATSKGKEKEIGVKALLRRASDRVSQYARDIRAAWNAGLSVKHDTVRGSTDILPEARGSLLSRTQEKVIASDPIKTRGATVLKSAREFAAFVESVCVGTAEAPRVCTEATAELLPLLLVRMTKLVSDLQASKEGSDDLARELLASAIDLFPISSEITEEKTADSDDGEELPEEPKAIEAPAIAEKAA